MARNIGFLACSGASIAQPRKAMLQLDAERPLSSGEQAGIEHALCLQTDLWPVRVELTTEHQFGEGVEEAGLLGAGGIAAGFVDGFEVMPAVHVSAAAVERELAAREAELCVCAGEGQDEVGDLEQGFVTANNGPLRVGGVE